MFISILLECSLIFIFTLLFVKYIHKYAYSLGIIDIPNARSSHTNVIARGGGIGFFSAVILVFPFFHFELLYTHIWAYLAIFIVFIVGVIDDKHTAAPNVKFIVILLATFLLYLDGIIIDDIGTFFGITIYLGWFSLPFTIFAVVGFTNALNLIDGIDGLSSTLSIIILGALGIVGYLHGDFFMLITALTFIVSLLAFLVFNWHPASIFMGDSGSLTLGFVISLLSIKALAYISAVSILFLAAIPLLDTLYVIIRRKINNRSAFTPDKCHIHHLVNAYMQGSVKKTVLVLGLLQFMYTLFALSLDKTIDEGILFILFGANLFLVYKVLMRVIKQLGREC